MYYYFSKSTINYKCGLIEDAFCSSISMFKLRCPKSSWPSFFIFPLSIPTANTLINQNLPLLLFPLIIHLNSLLIDFSRRVTLSSALYTFYMGQCPLPPVSHLPSYLVYSLSFSVTRSGSSVLRKKVEHVLWHLRYSGFLTFYQYFHSLSLP